MKNVSKLLLLGILAGAGYFFGIVVYGADCPSVFWSFICSPSANDVCNNPWSTCLCNGVTINHGVVCSSSIDPTADGTPWTSLNGTICADADGCMCWSSLIAKGATCSIISSDTTAPILVWGSVSVSSNTANFPFTCSEGNVKISCLWSCWSCSLTANSGNNTVSFTLWNGTYSNCSLVGQDSAGNISSTLSIPSFTINVTNNNWGTTTVVWGSSGWAPVCSDSNLVCVNGVYKPKDGYVCYFWNVGKACSWNWYVSLSTILATIPWATETWFQASLEAVKAKSTLYENKPQGFIVKLYVPKYKNSLIKKTILTLNTRLLSAISKKIVKYTDPSYSIENYQNLGADAKITMYKDIGTLVKTYNDFLWVLYMVLDMKQKEYLPVAKYYLELYFKEFAKFIK